MAALLLGGFASTHAAALTTPACLAKKLRAWGNLRRCQLIENGKALEGKASTLTGCQATFTNAMAKAEAQATAAGIACRFGVNGDGTVTDYDTGLQWEQKTTDGSVHDVSIFYTWSSASPTQPDGTAFTVFLAALNNSMSHDGRTISGCFAGHCDWRIPTLEDAARGIAPEPVAPQSDDTGYWSSTTTADSPDVAWQLFGGEDGFPKSAPRYVVAVRSAF
jgi:hypothetical protein